MSDKTNEEVLDEIVSEGRRTLHGWSAALVALVAMAWSLFHMALPQLLLLSSNHVRAIHLAFAMFLTFLVFGRSRKARKQRTTLTFLDVGLASIAALAVLYGVIDYEGISARAGDLLTRDLVIGSFIIVILLEATRRAVGKPLPIIATVFIAYSFFSEYMPEIISFKNASIAKVVNKLSLSTGGIFGVPLDVSATTVFLFVLFGAMLDKAGGSQYFIQCAYSLLGRFKGGPAKAAVLASGLTGMVSGSSIANTVTTGTFTIPLMKKSGYSGIKAGAIEVASSTNGQLMPPIMGAAAFIMAEYCNLTYFEVVRAAIIPALISYLALIYITHLEASKLGLKGVPKEELPLIKPLLLGGIPFLVPLGFLLYQLMVMRRSPQLSAYYAICALMGVMVARELWFGQREKRSFISSIKNAGLLISDSLVAGAQSMIAIAVAVATAGIIVGIVTLGLGAVITDLIDILSGGMLVPLLLITAVASLILGMGLPTTANYIVMASLTVPVIVTLGGESGLVVPVIAAHMFCFYFGILADDTPPVALAAYAAAAISKADPFRTGVQGFLYDMRTAILPFIFIFNTDLLLIGIDGWASIVWVFVTALIAMFGFAALTQNWLIAKNRMYESLLLAAMSILLFRPDVGQMVFDGMSKLSVQIAALILLAVVLLSQKMRIVRSTSSELVEST